VTWYQALILGALQGATEFLPISSSGHLVLFPWLFGWDIDAEVLFPFTVVVHWGTLLAVITAFWGNLVRLSSAVFQGIRTREPLGSVDAKLAWLLLLATIPAALAGVLFDNQIRGAFAQPQVVGVLLLFNGGLLMMGEWFRTRRDSVSKLSELRVPDAIVVGLFQMLALFPGISRSGSTIVGGLSRGFSRLESARFALLGSNRLDLHSCSRCRLCSARASLRLATSARFLPIPHKNSHSDLWPRRPLGLPLSAGSYDFFRMAHCGDSPHTAR
jgi:undecaprenyl-diphosphatase